MFGAIIVGIIIIIIIIITSETFVKYDTQTTFIRKIYRKDGLVSVTVYWGYY